MATRPIAALITADEFLDLYSRKEDGLDRYELFEGDVVPRPMPNRIHDTIKNTVGKRLDRYFDTFAGYIALIETTFKVSGIVSFTPDVAVVNVERWNSITEKFATGSPDIAFEVISSDTADHLQSKIDTYLESGSKAVCCIYPGQRRILVITPGLWTEFKGSDSLQFPALLPGFVIPLETIFGLAGHS